MTKLITTEDWFRDQPWIDRPDANIDRFLDTASANYDFDLRQKLTEWRDRGIVIFEQVVDPALIDAYLADIAYLKEHHKAYTMTAELRGSQNPIAHYTREQLDMSGFKFNQMHQYSLAAVEMSLTREVMQFLAAIFEAPPVLQQSLTFYMGSQQPIHLDYPYVRIQTRLAHLAATWIPLEDIHPDSGPLAYYPGSHKTDVSGFFDWGGGSILYEPDSDKKPIEFSYYLADRMKETKSEPQVFLPKKGDVLIWHGNLSHEGTKIVDQARTRRSYVTHYTSLPAYPSDFMKPNALETGEFVERHGGYCFQNPWTTGPFLPSWQKAFPESPTVRFKRLAQRILGRG